MPSEWSTMTALEYLQVPLAAALAMDGCMQMPALGLWQS
jgi:hypothetical protein